MFLLLFKYIMMHECNRQRDKNTLQQIQVLHLVKICFIEVAHTVYSITKCSRNQLIVFAILEVTDMFKLSKVNRISA